MVSSLVFRLMILQSCCFYKFFQVVLLLMPYLLDTLHLLLVMAYTKHCLDSCSNPGFLTKYTSSLIDALNHAFYS